APADRRRGVAGAVAGRRRRRVRLPARPAGRRHDAAARRAGPAARAVGRRRRHLPAGGPGRAERADRDGHPRARHRRVLRPAARGAARDRAQRGGGSLMTWVNAVLQGIFLGGLYALFACGLSLLFGVMRIINLAHGDLAVLGAFLVWTISTRANISPFWAMLLALPVMLVFGYVLQRTVLSRSLRGGPLTPLLVTFGLGIVIQNGLLQAYSPDVRSLGGSAGRVATGSWRLTDQLFIPYIGVLTLASAVLVLGGLQLVLRRTGFGRDMRATAQDPDTATLV